MTQLATIIDGEADLADVLFLLAFLLFCIVAVMNLMRRSVEAALTSFGLAAVALGWLVL
jgi:hypothetical protein